MSPSLVETPRVPLAEICSRISSGGTPSRKRPDYFGSGADHPWVKSQELLDGTIRGTSEHITDAGLKNSSAKYYQPGTVLLAMYGANVGQLGLLGIPATVNQAICGLCVDPSRAEPRYVFYAVLTTRRDLVGLAAGAAQQNLNQELIRQFSIPLPPLPTQRRIVAILSPYDDLIENNTRRIRLLEEMVQRIYRAWFVDFQYPGHETVPLVESELGPIPQGWAVAPMGDHVRVVRGRSYRGVDLAERGGLPFVNLKCVARDGGFRADGLKRYVGEFKHAHRVVRGDIVVAVTDMTQERRIVARAAQIPELDEDFGIISMDLVKIVPTDVPGEYLHGMLRYSDFADEVKAHANGANVLHLHPDRITDFRTVFPSMDLAERYAALVAPMEALRDRLESASQRLRVARDALLPRLISGEIDVEHLDIQVPEAA